MAILNIIKIFLIGKWKLILAFFVITILAFGFGYFKGKAVVKNQQVYQEAKEIINRIEEENKIVKQGNELKEEFITIKQKARSNPTKENLKIRNDFYTCLLSNNPVKENCVK